MWQSPKTLFCSSRLQKRNSRAIVRWWRLMYSGRAYMLLYFYIFNAAFILICNPMSFKKMILRRYPSVSPDCPRSPWPRKLVKPFLVIERMKHEPSWLSEDSDTKTVAEPRNLNSEPKSHHATGLSKKKNSRKSCWAGLPKMSKGVHVWELNMASYGTESQRKKTIPLSILLQSLWFSPVSGKC